ncbi:outer membrane protein assembly factor BamB family protein [Gimesia fumaroli]|jgi:outer membrane protein assembly factor BamB|uniref:PQQ enzyme repeat protein n=1 Tax=Gimesia fumaroli TaxID=2527976 RepID=A0A518IJ94_9PLAN|nr:PQQ-binding-like beta-propeller repeat protein [Gimesia fumaroli]QDV53169.1 PQQ enzyme repeat protein [Gimesia fumaroli]
MSGGFLDEPNFKDGRSQAGDQRSVSDFLFVSFNSRVLALDRDTGELLWNWKAPKGRSNYVSILVDDEQLFVSVDGYTYCLDPYTGQQIWFNPLKGFGYGIPTLATAEFHTNAASAAEIITREQRRQDNGAQ